MIIITGGAGFIGSNLLAALNSQGRDDILIVDDLTDGTKFRNLAPYQYYDYMDKTEFLHRIQADQTFAKRIDQVFHEGACSDTTEWDGKYMMENNYAYSKAVLKYCLARQIPFLYASSAAVYGGNTSFVEAPEYEAPLNVYAYSKLLFDNHVRRILPTAQSQIVGFRYFNVYGPQEQHKGTMASMAYHFSEQLIKDNETRLFEGSDGFGNGEQRGDFVFVGDVAAVNLWFMRHTDKSGIFNVGTGRSQSFNEMADAVIACHGSGTKRYIPFPDHLKGCYQSFTEADLSKLRAAGCDVEFHDVAVGVAKTMAVENDGDPEAAEAAEGVDSVGSAPVVESSLHVRKVQEA